MMAILKRWKGIMRYNKSSLKITAFPFFTIS